MFVFKTTSAKQISADLGLSLSLIYKWAEPPEKVDGSGLTNPLDRMEQLIRSTGDARLPPRVHILPLPAYSPELNPPERLWDVIKDDLCNRIYESIDALERAACAALQPFIRNAPRIRQLVGNGWMYLQANNSSPTLYR